MTLAGRRAIHSHFAAHRDAMLLHRFAMARLDVGLKPTPRFGNALYRSPSVPPDCYIPALKRELFSLEGSVFFL